MNIDERLGITWKDDIPHREKCYDKLLNEDVKEKEEKLEM